MGVTITHQNEQPRIYVACLAAYNNGILHGTWIDAAQEPWALWDEVRASLRWRLKIGFTSGRSISSYSPINAPASSSANGRPQWRHCVGR
ncbi:antirestriction protein ArdA [Sphingobium sp. HBC34]|uniref:Antirestriction protein ArdA n=1 Tax=Sphingobium cyanobacteriorum TaxID=3063954 RepID=A0ABT8ZTN3_9SPHN|nr:antirestriction protein ArdA [Sphingobium sp. HBC34]MDO7837100.1 antirestriction protein ArdA [Sphingobium sp. HBC34]